MAYGYGPPPPPPSASAGSPGYGHSFPQHGHGRGGGAGRGRGGSYQQPVQPTYNYTAQPYQHHAPPYGQPPPAGAAYPPQHWGHDQAHVASHSPSPLSATNYHPNYAPPPSYPAQQYPQSSPYPHVHPHSQPPQQYGAPYQGSPNTPHWESQGSPQQTSYGGGRARGGQHDRGGHKAGPSRPSYGHEQFAPPPSGPYPPYPDPRTSPYSPAPFRYPGPPPPPPSSAPADNFHHKNHNQRRGRGGQRGRGGPNNHDHGDRARHQNKGSNNNHTHENRPQQQQGSHKSQAKEAPANGKKKKRKTNTLGLTPGMDSETEDDEGEEKVLNDLIGTETLNVKDIAVFLAERKKNYPTKARVEAKKAKQMKQQPNKADDEAALLEKQADKLRKQLRKVESSIKRKREQGDEGDDMRDPSSVASSDDEKPEVASSRAPAASAQAPPEKKADISRHCKYFSTGGTCGKKGKCRFVHDAEVREAAIKEREANNGRLTIQQRLILNDKEQEDLTVLQSIQYLRGKGLMKPTDASEVKEEKDGDTTPKKNAASVSAPKTSLLPAAPASLPQPPAKREAGLPRRQPPASIIPSATDSSAQSLEHYQEWLSEPYGSSEGKQPESDDFP